MVNEWGGSNHKLALLRNLDNKVLTFTAEKGTSHSTWRAAGYPTEMLRPLQDHLSLLRPRNSQSLTTVDRKSSPDVFTAEQAHIVEVTCNAFLPLLEQSLYNCLQLGHLVVNKTIKFSALVALEALCYFVVATTSTNSDCCPYSIATTSTNSDCTSCAL